MPDLAAPSFTYPLRHSILSEKGILPNSMRFSFLDFQTEVSLPDFSSCGVRLQQHEDASRPRREFMTAAAQPTPVSTEIASAGQFMEQAPHSMQASRF